MLEVGTKIFGNLVGSHGESAGRTGFERDFPKLYQAKVTKEMVSAFVRRALRTPAGPSPRDTSRHGSSTDLTHANRRGPVDHLWA
jgi:hypothetical protein